MVYPPNDEETVRLKCYFGKHKQSSRMFQRNLPRMVFGYAWKGGKGRGKRNALSPFMGIQVQGRLNL